MTLQQILYLANQHSKHEWNHMKFVAALQGVDLDKSAKRSRAYTPAPQRTSSEPSDEPLFKHPDYYKSWTPEQREQETQKMLKILKPWAGKALG